MAITIYTNEDIKPGAIAGQRIAITSANGRHPRSSASGSHSPL